jgi:hypothetical protein
MKKFGKYAIAGAGMATLMTPTLSSAGNYKIHGRAKVTFKMPGQKRGDIIAGGKWKSKEIKAKDRTWDGYFHKVDDGKYKSAGIFTMKQNNQIASGTWNGVWNYNANRNKWIGKGTLDLGNDGIIDGYWKGVKKSGRKAIRWTVTKL